MKAKLVLLGLVVADEDIKEHPSLFRQQPLRDEGTSYHYQPAIPEIAASQCRFAGFSWFRAARIFIAWARLDDWRHFPRNCDSCAGEDLASTLAAFRAFEFASSLCGGSSVWGGLGYAQIWLIMDLDLKIRWPIWRFRSLWPYRKNENQLFNWRFLVFNIRLSRSRLEAYQSDHLWREKVLIVYRAVNLRSVSQRHYSHT